MIYSLRLRGWFARVFVEVYNLMAINDYNILCDDLYSEMSINTEMELPTGRDTILSFFERVQKQFPSMGNFYRRKKTEFCLEENGEGGSYRWLTLEKNSISSGMANPGSLEDVYSLDRLVLELVPYMLSVSYLDINSLDVTFGMDFDYYGNGDEVIAEAFFGSTPFNSLIELPGANVTGLSPNMVIALTSDQLTQARISIESKTGANEPEKSKRESDDMISLAFTIRQYPGSLAKLDMMQSFEYQCRLAEELMVDKFIPNFVRPLVNVIAHKRL
ncbi:MAG: hypothetical protein E4H40_04475 [Candidatus Brocadiia bacterium]|nr:MAG: hypothetical protein E4H40_04475 [Candidatus Brocadiia bacterium]